MNNNTSIHSICGFSKKVKPIVLSCVSRCFRYHFHLKHRKVNEAIFLQGLYFLFISCTCSKSAYLINACTWTMHAITKCTFQINDKFPLRFKCKKVQQQQRKLQGLLVLFTFVSPKLFYVIFSIVWTCVSQNAIDAIESMWIFWI